MVTSREKGAAVRIPFLIISRIVADGPINPQPIGDTRLFQAAALIISREKMIVRNDRFELSLCRADFGEDRAQHWRRTAPIFDIALREMHLAEAIPIGRCEAELFAKPYGTIA